MNLKNIKAALKLLKDSIMEVKFTDMKLKDGTTVIRYDAEELAISVPIMVITDQGEIAIPDGDYETEAGDKFTTVGGVVTAATLAPEQPEAPETPAASPAKPSPMPAQGMTEAQAKSVIESIIKESHFISEETFNAKIKELTDAKEVELKSVTENFKTQKEGFEKEIADLKTKYEKVTENFGKALELIEKIGETESETPAARPKAKAAISLNEQRKAFKEDIAALEAKGIEAK